METDPAAFVQAPVSAEGPVVKTEPTPGESQEIPVLPLGQRRTRRLWKRVPRPSGTL